MYGVRTNFEIKYTEIQEILKNDKLIRFVDSIEERFDILIENYFDFENTIYQTTSRDIIFTNHVVPNMFIMKRSIIRSLNNLLSSSRLFIDQTARYTKKQDESLYNVIEEKKHSIFDSCASYRLMEYLRNSMQHRFLPIGISYTGDLLQYKKEEKVLRSLNINISKQMILDDKLENNKHIRKDLENYQNDTINIKQDIRNYINNIIDVFILLRTNTNIDYDDSIKYFENTFQKFKIIDWLDDREINRVLDIYSLDDNDQYKLIKRISDICIKNSKYLKYKNGSPVSYSKFVIEN